MSRYEVFLFKAESCEERAQIVWSDEPLRQFYLNAAEGFRIKARNLTIEQADD